MPFCHENAFGFLSLVTMLVGMTNSSPTKKTRNYRRRIRSHSRLGLVAVVVTSVNYWRDRCHGVRVVVMMSWFWALSGWDPLAWGM